MNFQYYKTLMDKSEENLFFLIEKIVPEPLKLELDIFLEGINLGKKQTQHQKRSLKDDYIEFDTRNAQLADLSNLSIEQLREMYETFVSKERSDKKSVKWRLFQFLRVQKDLKFNQIHVKKNTHKEDAIDIIVETNTNSYIFFNCSYILEKEYYIDLLKKTVEFADENNIKPEKIIFSAHKTYRNIPFQEQIEMGSIKYNAEKEIWVEWVELEKPFNGEDLLIVLSNEKKKIEMAGFNFSSIESLLDYVYKHSSGGQIAVYKQPRYFSKKTKENPQIELIWKGIMLKK